MIADLWIDIKCAFQDYLVDLLPAFDSNQFSGTLWADVAVWLSRPAHYVDLATAAICLGLLLTLIAVLAMIKFIQWSTQLYQAIRH